MLLKLRQSVKLPDCGCEDAEKKAVTFSRRPTIPSTESLPGSSIQKEKKSNFGNRQSANDQRQLASARICGQHESAVKQTVNLTYAADGFLQSTNVWRVLAAENLLTSGARINLRSFGIRSPVSQHVYELGQSLPGVQPFHTDLPGPREMERYLVPVSRVVRKRPELPRTCRAVHN